MVTGEEQKAERLSSFFASVSLPPSLKGNSSHMFQWTKTEELRKVNKMVRDCLANMDEFYSPDQVYPRSSKEHADVILEPLSVILGKSWRMGNMPEKRSRINVVLSFQKWGPGGAGRGPE